MIYNNDFFQSLSFSHNWMLIFFLNNFIQQGPILSAALPDKQHTLWLHGNTILKPLHSVAAPNANLNSEYAEVTQIVRNTNISAPPEPYATVII